jgi:glycogen synthase kinase 3 beta
MEKRINTLTSNTEKDINMKNKNEKEKEIEIEIDSYKNKNINQNQNININFNINSSSNLNLTSKNKGKEIESESEKEMNQNSLKFDIIEEIGSGSFGVVYLAKIIENNELVAIKKVYQDKKYKNRELQILKELNHTNVIKLRQFFYSKGNSKDNNKDKESHNDDNDIYLNCVMDYLPLTLSKFIKSFKNKTQCPLLYIKLYSYQMIKSLAYIHSIGICHRDIKPQNILLNTKKRNLKLCDFGSAKKLIKGEPNIAYICSRYYRAPELIFGATEYTNAIDVWSIGCCIAEIVIQQPLFPGSSATDQLVEIIKILGTPSKTQIYEMNPKYKEFKFPTVKQFPWVKFFKGKNVDEDYVDLISKLLVYEPNFRLKPLNALLHPFFDELRIEGKKLPNGDEIPKELFIFTKEEYNSDPISVEKLIPNWVK